MDHLDVRSRRPRHRKQKAAGPARHSHRPDRPLGKPIDELGRFKVDELLGPVGRDRRGDAQRRIAIEQTGLNRQNQLERQQRGDAADLDRGRLAKDPPIDLSPKRMLGRFGIGGNEIIAAGKNIDVAGKNIDVAGNNIDVGGKNIEVRVDWIGRFGKRRRANALRQIDLKQGGPFDRLAIDTEDFGAGRWIPGIDRELHSIRCEEGLMPGEMPRRWLHGSAPNVPADWSSPGCESAGIRMIGATTKKPRRPLA